MVTHNLYCSNAHIVNSNLVKTVGYASFTDFIKHQINSDHKGLCIQASYLVSSTEDVEDNWLSHCSQSHIQVS